MAINMTTKKTTDKKLSWQPFAAKDDELFLDLQAPCEGKKAGGEWPDSHGNETTSLRENTDFEAFAVDPVEAMLHEKFADTPLLRSRR